MPYIDKKKRTKYEKGLTEILSVLNKVPKENVDGELNYVISMMLKDIYKPSYHNYNKAIGVLESVKLEFYRREVASYENKKIKENDDIYSLPITFL
jgi:hypothetical protein|tara:strand:+ start:292 stop:579 length:288 start_codon:yes stop_codon:yes gene_type:complete